MKRELDKKLVNKYPKIFAERYAPMTETAMCWGFDCGDGWYWLIDRLCESIQSYIDNNPHRNISQVVAVQVKEKFGTLSFYFKGGDNIIEGMVWLAENMSGHICENCGSTKDVSTYTNKHRWISTLCNKCKAKQKIYERKREISSTLFIFKFKIKTKIRKLWKKLNSVLTFGQN